MSDKVEIGLTSQQPLVSICIPLYNAQEYLQETLERLLAQTYANIEVVIVDDHSTDNSVSIVSGFKSDKIQLYTNPKKGGQSARNYAFSKATGDYIKFMDADDYCSPAMIENQLKCLLERGTDNTLVFSPVYMFYNDGEIIEVERNIDKDYTPGIELVTAIWSGKGFNCPHCHLMHRSLIEKTGGWDETIIKNQDGEFFARVANYADMALSFPDEHAMWRQTRKGVSSNLSLKAHESVIETFGIIIKMILSYKNDAHNKFICGQKLGLYLYSNYPQITPLVPRIKQILAENNCTLVLPNKKILNLLSSLLGWKTALSIIHRFNLN